MAEEGQQQAQQAQQAQQTFHQSLGPDFAAHQGLSKFQDAAALAKSYVSLEQKLGQRGDVAIPAEVTTESIMPIMERLGRPAEMGDAYKFEAVEGASRGLAPDSEFSRVFSEAAHKAGVTPMQAKAIYEAVGKGSAQSVKAASMQRAIDAQTASDALRKAWGANYEANLKASEYAASRLGIAEPLSRAGLNRDAAVMNAMASLGNMLAEDPAMGLAGGRRAFGGGPSRADLAAQANKLVSDSWGADISRERRAEMQNEALRLREQAARYG